MKDLNSPLLLVVEVTGNCNLNCKYCYAKYKCTDKKYINFDILKNIVDEASSLGVFDINICGGEPFLYPNIIDILYYIRSKNIDISLNTNATLITNDVAKELKKLDIIKDIQVSFDSYKDNIHNLTRGNYIEAIEGFKNLISYSHYYDSPIIGIVLNKYNLNDLIDTVLFFSKYTNRFHIMNVMNNKDLELDDNQKKLFKENILPILIKISKENSINISQFKNRTSNFSLKNSHIDCLAGYTFIAITSSLDIVPCDIARIPLYKYTKFGDIQNAYKISKELWKNRNSEWCNN